jgi:hypothetical protein
MRQNYVDTPPPLYTPGFTEPTTSSQISPPLVTQPNFHAAPPFNPSLNPPTYVQPTHHSTYIAHPSAQYPTIETELGFPPQQEPVTTPFPVNTLPFWRSKKGTILVVVVILGVLAIIAVVIGSVVHALAKGNKEPNQSIPSSSVGISRTTSDIYATTPPTFTTATQTRTVTQSIAVTATPTIGVAQG